MAGGGGQQGAAAPAQGGANTISGSTNPTPYQGSAAAQNLGQAAQGSMGSTTPTFGMQQAQNNALGAVSAPAGGGQNAMGPNVFGGGINPAAGGPYGGFNAQGQGEMQQTLPYKVPQGQLTPPQQAAIAYNANPQGQPIPQGMSGAAYAQPAMGGMQMDARLLDDGTVVGRNDPRFFGQGQPTPQGMPPQSGTAMFQGPAGAYGSGGTQGYAHSGAMQYNPQGQQGAASAPAFSPQSPMGGYPTMPQGAGPDVTGSNPASDMGYDRSGSDAGIGGEPVQGIQNPLGMGGKTSRAGGPYGGIMAGRPVMNQGEIPPSLSQMRPQEGGLKIQGNPTAQPFMRSQRMKQQQ